MVTHDFFPANANTATDTTAGNPLETLHHLLLEGGLQLTELPLADGRIHRVGCRCKPGDTEGGWYVLHAEPFPHGWFGCSRCTHQARNVSAKDSSQLTASEKAALAAAAKRREDEERAEQDAVAQKVRRHFVNLPDAKEDHPYLQRKQVDAYGLKSGVIDGEEALVVPLVDISGKLWSCQYLLTARNAYGHDKLFERGGRTKGLFCPLGEWRRAATLVIAEGYATAASIYEATKLPTVAALNCGNLLAVAIAFRRLLPRATIVVAADDDAFTEGNPGYNKAKDAAQAVGGILATPRFKSRTPQQTDFNDLMIAEGRDIVREQITASLPSGESNAPRAAQRLVELCRAENAELFHDSSGTAYATIPVDSHYETWPVESEPFQDWLMSRSLEVQGEVPSKATLADGLNTLCGLAKFSGEEETVHLRVCFDTEANRVLIDLTDATWRVVEVTTDGWKILDHSPVKFVRSANALPMPIPVAGGSIDSLWKMLNVVEENRIYIVGWLLAVLRGGFRSYPLLNLYGEQGTGKSKAAGILRKLTDPNRVPLRRWHGDESELWVIATRNHVLAFDNLSTLTGDQSDALAALATGAGIGKRKLYSNSDEHAIGGSRPILLNGIPDCVSRGDLADRTLAVELEVIPWENRRTDEDMDRLIAAELPGVFGALLDAIAQGLRVRGTLTMDRLPRLADVALWSAACEPVLGFEPGSLAYAIEMAAQRNAGQLVDSNPVAQAIQTLMESRSQWRGTYRELLAQLKSTRGQEDWGGKQFPDSPKALACSMRRVAPALRIVGIEIQAAGHSRVGCGVILAKREARLVGQRMVRSEANAL